MNTGIQLKDIEQAVILYYDRIELNNGDIRKLFGCGSSTAIKLKKIAMEKAIKENYQRIDARLVPTKAAYEAWGLNIEDLEKRLEKLKKYKERS